jgi:hypothetical protein
LMAKNQLIPAAGMASHDGGGSSPGSRGFA